MVIQSFLHQFSHKRLSDLERGAQYWLRGMVSKQAFPEEKDRRKWPWNYEKQGMVFKIIALLILGLTIWVIACGATSSQPAFSPYFILTISVCVKFEKRVVWARAARRADQSCNHRAGNLRFSRIRFCGGKEVHERNVRDFPVRSRAKSE